MIIKKGVIMKKLVLCLFSGLIVFSFSTIVYAEGTYFSGNIGAGILSDVVLSISGIPEKLVIEQGTDVALGLAVGHAFSNNIRAEIEFAYQKNNVDQVKFEGDDYYADGDTVSYACLLNGYYDFPNSSAFTPFIGAGIGYARVELNDFVMASDQLGSYDDSVFAYQVGAGVGYAVSEKIVLDYKYRYFATADPKFFNIVDAEYSSHNHYVGIRVFF